MIALSINDELVRIHRDPTPLELRIAEHLMRKRWHNAEDRKCAYDYLGGWDGIVESCAKHAFLSMPELQEAIDIIRLIRDDLPNDMLWAGNVNAGRHCTSEKIWASMIDQASPPIAEKSK